MKRTWPLLAVIAGFLFTGLLVIDRWPTTLYIGDSSFYYMHVVSAFVNQDVGDYDRTITTLQEVQPGTPDPRDDIYGIRLTEKGRRYIKYTVGVPLLETPFFLIAHLYASASPKYEANGWSAPYMLVVGSAIIVYVLIGFYFLIGVLRRYFDERTVWLTCLALAIATNLFYHTNYVVMSHGFLFFLHAWLLRATARFWDGPTGWRAAGLGAVVGLIALTRVPEAVAALVPVLWGVHDGKTLRARISFVRGHWWMAPVALVAFVAVFSLQMAYWYYVSGQLLFDPYQGEGFDFLKPRVWQAFFKFDNGWLIYTPIMAFALAGLFLLRRYRRGLLLAIAAFVLPHVWVHYSYYVYSYFPGLGQRPMVDTYPYLALPLAACFAVLLSKPRWRWVPVAAIGVFGALNLFQTWQSAQGIIWTERHNKAFYLESFGRLRPTQNGLRAYHTGEVQPDKYDHSLQDVVAELSFEEEAFAEVRSEGYARSGRYAYFSTQEFQTLAERVPLDAFAGGSYLEVGIHGFLAPGNWPGNRDQLGTIVLEIYDDEDRRRRYRRAPISVFLGNQDGNIWTLGTPGVWGRASFMAKLPGGTGPGWYAKAYLHNPYGQEVYLDDFFLHYYE